MAVSIPTGGSERAVTVSPIDTGIVVAYLLLVFGVGA